MFSYIVTQHIQVDPLAVDILALNRPPHLAPKSEVRQVDDLRQISPCSFL
jgi:hypothetical protein